MIFLHILVGNKEYIISGVRGTYSNAYTLIIVCTCDKDEFFVFKVHLFVNDLVSIIRFGKREEGYDDYKVIDGIDSRNSRLNGIGALFYPLLSFAPIYQR